MRSLIVTALAAVSLANGCTASDPAPRPSTFDSAAALASAAKCMDFVPSSDDQAFVKESGACAIDGIETFAFVFYDDKSRDQWLHSAKASDGAVSYVVGSRWVLESASEDAAKKAAQAAGGQLQT